MAHWRNGRNTCNCVSIPFPLSNQIEPQFVAHQGGGALEGFDGDVTLGFEDAIDLDAADVHFFGERSLGHALTFQFVRELPGNHARHRFGLPCFADTFIGQKTCRPLCPNGDFSCLCLHLG